MPVFEQDTRNNVKLQPIRIESPSMRAEEEESSFCKSIPFNLKNQFTSGIVGNEGSRDPVVELPKERDADTDGFEKSPLRFV